MDENLPGYFLKERAITPLEDAREVLRGCMFGVIEVKGCSVGAVWAGGHQSVGVIHGCGMVRRGGRC